MSTLDELAPEGVYPPANKILFPADATAIPCLVCESVPTVISCAFIKGLLVSPQVLAVALSTLLGTRIDSFAISPNAGSFLHEEKTSVVPATKQKHKVDANGFMVKNLEVDNN